VVLVTTVDPAGVPNVAPKSWISMAAFGPPAVVMFGCSLRHRTAQNALSVGEFVINVPGHELLRAAWAVGGGSPGEGPERFRRHGLTRRPSTRVRPPRIEECVAHLECELDGTREWSEEVAIFGRIVAVSMDADLLSGDTPERYGRLAPFFFAESGWAAGLGPLEPVG
jgi:flavin reductase (DIM6/NTAB) family NADH-FMN oxidoreductase RutF